MQELRITFRPVSSVGTPFQADTIFGHLCWAIRHLEGESALADFLAACDESTPLLVSDGFPAAGGHYYLPRPKLPPAFRKVSEGLGIDPGERAVWRQFASAAKLVEKKPFIAESVVQAHSDPLDMAAVTLEVFRLNVCPRTMAPVDREVCTCSSWRECPELTGASEGSACPVEPVRSAEQPVMHNVLNRLTSASENLWAGNDRFYGHGFHVLARIDGSVMTADRLRACWDYVALSGYGRDASTGKGALADVKVEEVRRDPPAGANGFINLSSGFVPRTGELGRGCYSVHVKRGKLGSFYVHSCASPFKRPVLMLEAGAVLEGDPALNYGGLVRGVHYLAPEVVQYGFAYPLAVKLNEEAF